jgi:hypothetical protein
MYLVHTMRGFEMASVWIGAASDITFERTLVAEIYVAVSIGSCLKNDGQHTTVKFCAVSMFTWETSCLISQGVQFSSAELRLMLEFAELPIGTFSFIQMPVVA